MARQLGNLEANLAVFNALPQAAQEQMGVELSALGQQVASLQRSLVPRRTGALASTLEVRVALGVLRLRSGILNVRANLKGRQGPAIGRGSDVFYGIILEYGRKAGQKVTTRRTPSGRTVTVRQAWSSLAPRPFVHVENSIEGQVEALRNRFWPAVLDKVGA